MYRHRTYIDLFSGCGGLSLGLRNSGWKGLFAVEKSKDAFETLHYNLIEVKNHFQWPKWLPIENHDIKDLLKNYSRHLSSLRGKVDLIAGAPPCQGFSIAGKKDRLDTRNQLVKYYLEFIFLISPKLVFFENVRGFSYLPNSDDSQLGFLTGRLEQLGYNICGKVIDMSMYGLPQKRKRFIMVGFRNDISRTGDLSAKTFFKLLSSNRKQFLRSKDIPLSPRLKDAISDLLMCNGTIQSTEGSTFQAGRYGTSKGRFQRYIRKGNRKSMPDSHRFSNHKKRVVHQFQHFIERQAGNRTVDQASKKQFNLRKHTIIPLCGELPAPTITTQPGDYIHYCEPRSLTVREFARLQSFPDWFVFKGRYTTGGKNRRHETPRYTQVGNAIPPLFAEQAGLALRALLRTIK